MGGGGGATPVLISVRVFLRSLYSNTVISDDTQKPEALMFLIKRLSKVPIYEAAIDERPFPLWR